LFDHGRLPPGHMHSDPLQIALERGVPALIVWLLLLGLYARLLWQLISSREVDYEEHLTSLPDNLPVPLSRWLARNSWIDRGVALGALGGLAGFFTSGLVHYNWGDSEVIMVFYFLMGLSLALQGTRQYSEW